MKVAVWLRRDEDCVRETMKSRTRSEVHVGKVTRWAGETRQQHVELHRQTPLSAVQDESETRALLLVFRLGLSPSKTHGTCETN